MCKNKNDVYRNFIRTNKTFILIIILERVIEYFGKN